MEQKKEHDGGETAEAAGKVGIATRGFRLLLCAVVGGGVCLLGLTHYKTRRDEARRADYKPVTSGGYVERLPSANRYPSRSELDVGGVKCEVERDYVAAPPGIALDNYAARKEGLGWSEVEPGNSASALALTDALSQSRYFLTPEGKVAGVMASKLSSGTKIMTVELDPFAFLSNADRAGSSLPLPTPREYLVLMPAPPKLAYHPLSAEGAELYVCQSGNGVAPEALIKKIRGNLAANGWKADIPENISNVKPLANKKTGTVISARKADVLCNITVTRRKDKSVAAFRFSNLKRADIGR